MIQIRPVCACLCCATARRQVRTPACPAEAVGRRTGRKENGFIRLRGSGYTDKISAPGADIIPKWSCIRTLSADMNKLGETTIREGEGKDD